MLSTTPDNGYAPISSSLHDDASAAGGAFKVTSEEGRCGTPCWAPTRATLSVSPDLMPSVMMPDGEIDQSDVSDVSGFEQQQSREHWETKIVAAGVRM